MSLMSRIIAAKVAKPAPKPEVPRTLKYAVERANQELGRDAGTIKLLTRAQEILGGGLEVASSYAPRPSGTARGSCKAVSAETGRQCALLAGHGESHRHGATAFVHVAAPGQSHFTRREALDHASTRRHGSTNPQGET